MALTKEQMDQLDKQAKLDDDRDKANADKLKDWHASEDCKKLFKPAPDDGRKA